MRRCPLTYRQCRQTVTIYHLEHGAVTRTVCRRAFLDFKKTQNVEKTGGTEVNSFLLVLPTDHKLVRVGDKVMMGEGPEIAGRDWSGFIPAKIDGLVVVRHEDPKYWRGRMVHQEAGG